MVMQGCSLVDHTTSCNEYICYFITYKKSIMAASQLNYQYQLLGSQHMLNMDNPHNSQSTSYALRLSFSDAAYSIF